MRDLTEKQFKAACKRHGFKPIRVLGYYDLGGIHVSIYNAGPTIREKLSYLIKEKEKYVSNHKPR